MPKAGTWTPDLSPARSCFNKAIGQSRVGIEKKGRVEHTTDKLKEQGDAERMTATRAPNTLALQQIRMTPTKSPYQLVTLPLNAS